MIERKEFARRRRRVMEALDDSCVMVVPTAPVLRRNRDIEFPFRPDSDFYYLTGFAEPESVAVLAPGRPEMHQDSDAHPCIACRGSEFGLPQAMVRKRPSRSPRPANPCQSDAVS